MGVDKGAAGEAEVSELVVAGHVVHETDIRDVESGFQEGHDGGLERGEVVLVGQSQEVQDYLQRERRKREEREREMKKLTSSFRSARHILPE